MSSSIRQAKAGAPLFAPLDALRAAGIRTSLFQGCAYALDPRNQRGYLFQLQAVRTGPGDVEDLRVHRFRHHSDGTPTPLEYVDSMTILKGGHVQAAHVRISSAGDPMLWLGLEQYDENDKQDGAALYRVRYVAPKGADRPAGAIVRRAGDDNVQRVFTGPGSVTAIGCPDWTIVLRRPGDDADVFEWHREKYLLLSTTQKRAKDGDRPTPWHTVRVPHDPGDSYQSSVAQGKYDAPKRRAYRVRGADSVLVTNSDTPSAVLDLTAQARNALGADAHTEPEGACTIGGLLHVAVQTGSVAERRIAYFPLKW